MTVTVAREAMSEQRHPSAPSQAGDGSVTRLAKDLVAITLPCGRAEGARDGEGLNRYSCEVDRKRDRASGIN